MCTFQDLLGLSNKFSYKAGSFSCHLNTHWFFQSEVLRLYFPTLEPWIAGVCLAPLLFLLVYLHANVGLPGPLAAAFPTWSSSHYLTSSLSCHFDHPCPPALALTQIFSAQLPISAPPTILDECVFFISLVVRLPYNSIFCQFWLFFVFKFDVLLLVVEGGTVYLPIPPSWLEVPNFITL